VVGRRRLDDVGEGRRPRQDPLAVVRVHLHLRELGGGEPLRLVEDRVGEPERLDHGAIPHPRPQVVVGGDRQVGVGHARVEPPAAPRPHHVRGGLPSVSGVEDLGGLGQAGDAREKRDLLAATAVGLAEASCVPHRPPRGRS
jgi:hypothetical protein